MNQVSSLQNARVLYLKTGFFLLFILSLARVDSIQAQNLALESALYQGSVFRHSPKLSTQTGERIYGLELGLRVQTLGRHSWQAWQRYPSLGVSAALFQLGKGSHGTAIGLLPWLNIPLVRVSWFSSWFRVGTGFAWVTNPYQWWDNPGQNAIGSFRNNMTQFRLGAEARMNAHIRLSSGFAFSHFSNGGSALPNFGINVISGWLGVAWSPKALYKTDFKPAAESRRKVARRLGFLWQGSYASVQLASFDGPKYPVWITAASVLYRFNRMHRASMGLEYEKNRAIYEWGLHSARFPDEKTAEKSSSRIAFFIGEEFLFGDIGIQLQSGVYVGKQYNAFVPKPWFNKLSMRYYLPEKIRTPLRPFAGITLKAHAVTAEYIAFNVGFVW